MFLNALALLSVFPNFINEKLLNRVSRLGKDGHVDGKTAGDKVVADGPPQGANNWSDDHSEN